MKNKDNVENVFDKEESKWVPLVGQFIFDFATIEDYLHQVIEHHLSNTHIGINDISTSLPKRIKLFEKILIEGVLTDSPDLEKFKEVIKKILELVKVRNLVAHNSLGLAIYEKEGELRVGGFQINGRKDGEYFIDYESLKNNSFTLSNCRKELGEVMLEFYTSAHKNSERKALAKLLRA